MRRQLLCLTLALGVPVLAAAAPAGCSHDDLTKLVEDWNKADWQEWFRVGYGLSQCLVTDDDQFFRLMLKERSTFDSWMLGLGGHTFMYGDEEEKPQLERLKETMVEIADRASSNQEYGELAKSLAERLTTVEVTESPRTHHAEPGA